MLGVSWNSPAMVGMAMDSETRSTRLITVRAKTMAKMRQRTLLGFAAVALSWAGSAWSTAVCA
ncbi:TPA: hypothetical protein ACQ3ZL_003276 [Pseudomonas aeruginosa]